MRVDTVAIDQAKELGCEHARAAATWVELTRDDARAIVHDIDPEVLDRLEPRSPLAYELAGDLGMHGLADELDLDPYEDHDDLDAAADAFLDAFYETYHEELERAAVDLLKLHA